MGFSHIPALIIVVPWVSWSAACGLFLDWGLKPCLLHWQADSYLCHQKVSGWWFLHSCTKVFLGPETFPYRKVRSSHSQCWAKHLFANIFSLWTGLMCMSLFCLSGTWPTLPLLSVPGERGWGPPPAAWEGSRQAIFLCQLPDRTCWPWEPVLTLKADLALFSVSQASFHLVPVCVVSWWLQPETIHFKFLFIGNSLAVQWLGLSLRGPRFHVWWCCAVLSRTVVSDSVIPWTAARHAPPSMGILWARILERVAMPSSRGSSQLRDWIQVSHVVGRFFTDWATSLVGELKSHKPWGVVNKKNKQIS